MNEYAGDSPSAFSGAASAMAVPVLVVDDNASKRLALKAILTPLGHTVVEADSGEAALRCVIAQDFAVILLDVCMPLMDGFETAALMRLRRQSEMTPIIFITAFGSDEIVDKNRYAEGAVDFMFAPVAPEELRAKVSVFANLFIKAEALATRAREVQASADQLRQLTDAAPIGIFQTDGQNRYTYTNPRWSEITGLAPEAVLGQPWDTIVDASQRFALDPAHLGAAVDRSELSYRFEITRPDAAPLVVLLTSRRIPAGSGGATGWVGTLADVTAEAGAEAAMSEARDQATAASSLKSDFLANMSHEIRTPMNGVIGMTDLLLETDLDAVQRDYAQTVRNSGEALLAIISDILDFSKVEAGMLEVEEIEFNLQAIVHSVIDLLARPAQAKDIELVAVVDASVPEVVSGDPGRVRQVLTNLVGNAIKFTHSGEVVVRVSQDESSSLRPVLRFEVADTGDGITPETLETVFQPFIQGDSSTSRKYGGTGLGLAISSQLVSLMGGECGAASELGAGSTFWFTVRVGSVASPPSTLPAPDPALVGVHALIVDNNETQRRVLSDYLSGWGLVTSTASSGPAAWATLRTAAIQGQPFGVVLTASTMPGMHGVELARAIAADPTLSSRVVLMTGLGEERQSDEGAVCASLSKPIHSDSLLSCVLDAVAPERASGESAQQKRPAEAIPFDVGRLLLAEDNPINRKVAVAMLATGGYVVDSVVNGAEAVEAAATHRYDAILMDCQMPELNGFEAAAAIRSQEPPGVHTPIIALTAGARREDRERCLAAGMDSYLSKPVSKDALLSLVARSVTNRPVTVTALGPAAPVDEIVFDEAIFEDLQALAEGADEGFLAGLVEHFVLDTEPRLVGLKVALKAGDCAEVARIAHAIRGGCGQMGGRRLASSCSRLERKALAEEITGGQAEMQEVEFDFQELCRTLTLQVAAA